MGFVGIARSHAINKKTMRMLIEWSLDALELRLVVCFMGRIDCFVGVVEGGAVGLLPTAGAISVAGHFKRLKSVKLEAVDA